MAEGQKTVYLVGAGPGDYKLITLKAVECLQKADVVVYDRLVNRRFLDFAPATAEKIYVGKKSSQHSLPQEQINKLLVVKAKEGKTVVRLKGGDPYVFGRGGEEAEELRQDGIPFEIVPGITSAVAVPAYAGIPITHRDFVSSVHIITGHEKPEKDASSIDFSLLAKIEGTLIFLMGLGNLAYIRENLLANGVTPEKPVAVISQGTTPRQRKVVGTLADIEEKVLAAHLLPPSIIVVGEVVTLHDKLDWFFPRPLSGKRILITRTRSQASVLAEKIEEQGGEVYSFPTIQITAPDSYGPVDDSLNNIAAYQWIIFASSNGVESFFARQRHLGLDVRTMTGIKVAAIGAATGSALLAHGIVADYLPEEFMAESLVAGLKERIVPGQRVLLPTADIARKLIEDELRAAGVQVDKVDLYKTVPGSGDRDNLLEWLENREIDIITFTSSSTVENFMQILGRENIGLLKGVKVACIGPVTAAKAGELGLDIAIMAESFQIDGLVQAILADQAASALD